jgi:hypothetical protein
VLSVVTNSAFQDISNMKRIFYNGKLGYSQVI